MKREWQIFTGLMIGMVVLLVVIWGFTDRRQAVHLEKTNTEVISQIDINVEVLDLSIKVGDNYGYVIDGLDLDVSLANGRLMVSQPKGVVNANWFTNPKIDQVKVEITLPADHLLNELRIISVDGAVKLEQLTVDDLRGTLVNGNLKLVDSNVKSLQLKGVNALVTVQDTTSQVIDLDLVSGDMSLQGIESSGLTINSVSGNLQLQGVILGVTEIKSVSGKIKLDLQASKRDYAIAVDLMGGKLLVDDEPQLGNIDPLAPNKLYLSSVSGDITINFLK